MCKTKPNPSTAPVTSLHAARCCSDVQLPNFRLTTKSGIWSISRHPVTGECMSQVTFDQAEQACATYGARLCTNEDYEDHRSKQGHCKINRHQAWSSSPVPSNTTPSETTSSSPSEVTNSSPSETSSPVKVSLGNRHSCAVNKSNDLFCWGHNWGGQVGDGTTVNKSTPIPVSFGSGSTSKVKEVGLGSGHTCAMDISNKVFCWGSNTHGRLGDGSFTDRLTPTEIDLGIESSYAVQLSVGMYHNCVIDSLNNLLCWGRNNYGQLGDGTLVDKNTPVLIAPGTDPSYAIQVSSGGYHTCAIFSAGDLKCWGSNYYGSMEWGMLGNGGTNDLHTPTTISLGANVTPTQVELGFFYTCAIDNLSALRCWGSNRYGILGDGTNTHRNTPALVSLPADAANIIQVSLGWYHTCAISDKNDLLCWGLNWWGLLGLGSSGGTRNTPTLVSLGGSGVYATQVAVGYHHTCAFDNSDNLYCWGNNEKGQVGNGSTQNVLTPTLIPSIA